MFHCTCIHNTVLVYTRMLSVVYCTVFDYMCIVLYVHVLSRLDYNKLFGRYKSFSPVNK